jgi:hypothetical protein
VADGLAATRAEIEDAITVRAFAVASPTGAESPGYVEGLRAAIVAAVEYALTTIRLGLDHAGPTPAAVLAQARNAARANVGLDVVLRRYAAGYSALADCLVRETRHHDRVSDRQHYQLQRDLTALFDRLVEAVSAEYRDEVERLRPHDREAELIARLLEGELVDASGVPYDFEGHHLGVIAQGDDGEEQLRRLASKLDRRLLLVRRGERPAAGWLGGRQEFEPDHLDQLERMPRTPEGALVIGEPAKGLSGWRLTHRQSRAALGLALRGRRPFTRYGDVALLVAVSRDEDLNAFLCTSYLAPLATERDGGQALRETLRAYLAAGRNVSSAAAAIGIARQTVASRLQAVERKIDRPLDSCGCELELALRLADLDPRGPDAPP